ncbi:hypothetical protein F2Q68_00038931 [Brassica cretica]|uniref:Uncharacterized protein n=1 Tax=Brassica cretica TaxID=69181 RepID=A0A8S9MFC2_BRACR|nr:hypothetical protein F2Q68_00038931 [Brassica cretica]
MSIDTAHPTSFDTAHPTSFDTAHPTSIDTAHPTPIDTVHLTSIDTAHQPSIDTVHPPSTDTVHPPSTNTIHPPSDTTCLEAEKVEVLLLTVDENWMLRDEECCTRNSTGQLINAEGAVIPDVIDVAETNNFDLNCEWYDWGSVDPFRGLPHEDPRDLIKELGELASASEQNELLDDIMAKRDEQLVSGELSRVEEAGTEDATSTSTDGKTTTSIDGTTSTSTDITTSTSIDVTTSSSIDDVDREVTMEDSLELEE